MTESSVIPPVAVGAIGESVTSSLLWRYGGQLHLSVAVQARYALHSEATATRSPLSEGPNLGAAADSVPYRESCDVWIAGHCNTRPLNPTAQVTTRVVLSRGAATLLDQSMRVMHGSDVGVAGYGPRRRSALAGLERAGVIELARNFDWTAVHAAPPNQRVPYLEGDEMLVLEGLLPERPRVRCRLPRAVASARAWPRGSRPNDEGSPIQLVADTLGVDSDAGIVAIVWRGSFPIPDEHAARSLILAAGVTEDAPIDWYEGWVIGNATAALGTSVPSGTLELPAYPQPESGQTAPFAFPAVTGGAPWAERRTSTLPFVRAGTATVEVDDSDTSDLTKDEVAPPSAALPFQAPQHAPAPGAPGTGLETLDTPAPAEKPATPFEKTSTDWPRRR